MALSTFFTAIILVTLSFISHVQALSIARNTPSHITQIEDLKVVTGSEPISASSNVDLIFSLRGESREIKLQLTPNHDLFSGSATVHRLGVDGSISSARPVQRSRHYIYKGHASVRHSSYSQWENVGIARITVRPAEESTLFEGTFTVNGERFHVQLDSNFRKTQPTHEYLVRRSGNPYMVAWKDGDEHEHASKNKRGTASNEELQCGVDGSGAYDLRSLASNKTRSSSRSAKLGERQWWDDDTNGQNFSNDLKSTIGSTDGCPTERLIALLGIATDCSYTADFGSADDVEANIFTQINSASQVYEDSFNITLAIRNITISDARCPSGSSSQPWNVACSDSVDTSARLGLFSTWRGQFQDGNALWMLMTGCRSSSTVGISWMGEVCTQGSRTFSQNGQTRTSSSTNVVVRTGQEWQVMAHEIGHSFGASHDCTSTTCSDGTSSSNGCCPLSSSTCDANSQYIMNPSARSGIQRFSPCSIGAICANIGRGSIQTSCLRNNNDVTVLSGPACATKTGSEACKVTGSGTSGNDLTNTNNLGRTGGGSRSWFDKNKALVIGLSAGVGSLCLLIIVSCILWRIRRKRNARLAAKEASLPPPPYTYR